MEEIVIPEKRITVYEYSELSDEAKNTAKEKLFIEDPYRTDILQEYFDEELMCMFPESSLKAQFSLCSRQGDGVNIFGELDGRDAAQLLRDPDFKKECEEKFSPEETERAANILSRCRNIRLPENPDYSYCMAGQANILDPLCDAAPLDGDDIAGLGFYADIELFIISCIEAICRRFKEEGYKFLYEPDEEEVEEIAAVQKWLFLENGEPYKRSGAA